VEETVMDIVTYALLNGKIKDYASNVDELRNTLNQLKADTFGDINLTGTNTTGSTITAGTFFYNNGSLVRAKADILDGSTITTSNSESVTKGGLNNASVWKFLGVKNGTTDRIAIPDYANEIYVVQEYNSSAFSNVIPVASLSTTMRFRNGAYYNSTTAYGCSFYASKTEVYISNFYINQNDVTANSTLTVYYR
jgi:hypothetical protein